MRLKGQTIKHKKYRDVAFQVVNCFDAGKKLKIKGYWVNQACVKTYIMWLSAPKLDKIEIKKEDVKDWLFSGNPNAVCIRNEPWLQLKVY